MPEMSAAKDRAANRQKRRGDKAPNHEPLLRLVQDEPRRKPVKAKEIELKPLTEAQRLYDNAIHVNDITFGIGPAGTGKTWWAAMRAAEALKDKKIERIIVTRPAVEAGEKLGFLPGEMEEKYGPYFRPVKDALEESFGSGALEYYLKSETIEARPLNYLRGSTLKNCWVIADEMQNATKIEMKLLLTRIGEGAKFIINGDPTQCDLPNPANSGLMDAVNRLKGVKSIDVVRFGVADIVRHGLVQKIVEAYETRTDEDPRADRYNVQDSDDRDGLNRVLGVHG
jgi:phosphate starvation-inducible PhoH-like protein